jgi:hypothetical protein
MRQLKLIAMAVVASVAACGARQIAAQVQQQGTDRSPEYNAYQAAHNQARAQLKAKLLAEFVTTYPSSDFLPDAYRDTYLTYFSLGDYPKTVEYADKFLVFQARIDSADRLEALITRAEAFLAGCVDAVLQTPEAYGSARTAAKEGLEALGQLPKAPDCVRPGPCRSERERIQSLFNSVARITESGLKGETVDSCKGPGSPAMFNHVIETLKEQERQTPQIR